MITVVVLFAGLATGVIVGAWTLAMFSHGVRAHRMDSQDLWLPRTGTRPVSGLRKPVVVVMDGSTPAGRRMLPAASIQEVNSRDLED